MRLSVSMYSYYRPVKEGRLDLPGFIREAKRIRADGVELLDFFYGDVDSDRELALGALAETGLPCPIFSVAQNFAKVDQAERKAQLEKIRFGVDEALIYGAKVVRVFAGDVSEFVGFDQARAWIVEGLTEAALYAQEKGVRLALENHGKLAGRGIQVRGLIEDVRQKAGNDALGANPDTGNFLLVNEPSHEAIQEVANLAYMVHFKDFRLAKPEESEHLYKALDGTSFVGTAIGEGDVDLTSCVARLREAEFDDWLSIEYEGVEDSFTAVQRSVTNARTYI
jgi:sugar phosphate isomerase/epimerase